MFALAALCVVLPMLLHGCSCGHDFDFHLLSWMEASSQWQHGILKPVWAFTPAFNAGEPRLLLYPPLSWITGGALGLVLPWSAVPIAFTWLVLFLCGLSMHRLLARWTSPAVATLGGCLYLVNPYMLFVAYERTAYAELMAAAWMPLLLIAMLRPRVTAPRVAFAVGLLWLTNAPAAVVGCYSVLLLGVARLLLMRGAGLRPRLLLAGRVAGGVGLGLLLDAFYLIPMGWQRRFVQLALAIVPIARPDANFLFTVDKDAFHTHVLVQASWIAIGLCAVAALCGAVLLLQKRAVQSFSSMRARDVGVTEELSQRRVVAALLGFTIAVFFLLCRWSAPVWHVAPELVFLQFPWRFLAVESSVAVALLALVLQRFGGALRGRYLLPAALLVTLLAGYFAGGRYFREECADDESVQAQRNQFLKEEGVAPTDEYTPEIADNDDLPIHLPPAWLATVADDEPGKQPNLPQTDRTQPEDLHFASAATARPQVLIVRLRQYPGWHTLLDGNEINPPTRPDGLIAVPLAAGQAHRVEVVYRTTADQWAGIAVSALTVLGCGLARRRRWSGIMGPSA
ncbi:MAG: hypothetical protein ACRYHB_02535 [Janthinobacterium lividum]